jgi:phage tail sheath protein FI
MSVYVSPGVYTREIDLSLYVPALSTTIVGMVGVTSKGPTEERVYISNQQQFINTFGPPDSSIGYETYAALQYLRRGRQLWFVRVVGDSAEAATITMPYGDPTLAETINTDPNDILVSFADSDSGGSVFTNLPITPGSIDITATIGAAPFQITDDGAGVLSGTGPTGAISGTIDYATGEWTIDFDASDPPDDTTDLVVDYSAAVDAFDVTAVNEGEWGNNLAIVIEDGTAVSTKRILVYYEGTKVERFDSIDLDDTSGNANFIETKVNGVSDYITITLDVGLAGASSELPSDVASPGTSLAAGDSDASAVLAADIIGEAWDVGLQQPTGLQLLASPSAVDINLLASPGWADAAVVNEMLQLCETRADCMAIIDPPADLKPSEVVDWHNGAGTWAGQHAAFNSSYGALYYPWVKVYDSYNAVYVFTPPSGHALAVYAYTDYSTESWFAPAGMIRGRVISGVDIAYGPTPGEMDLLYGDGNAVNPIARFPKDGLVVWGQRTLQRAPTALDRINVRRLMLYLRKVISTASRYLVFEPNDEKTWTLFGQLVVPYLNDVRQRRGLYDFRVKCDSDTNTPEVIDRNEMHAQIFLKPVKAAEFIQIDLIITATGANFEEVLY